MFAYEGLSQRGSVRNAHAVVDAYAAAAGIPPDDACRIRAAKAWDHPAVRELFDMLEYRGVRQVSQRVTHRYGRLLERMLEDAEAPDATTKERVMVADSVVKFVKLIAHQNEVERALRRRDEARMKTIDQDEPDGPTGDVLAPYLKMLESRFGKDALLAHISGAEDDGRE